MFNITVPALFPHPFSPSFNVSFVLLLLCFNCVVAGRNMKTIFLLPSCIVLRPIEDDTMMMFDLWQEGSSTKEIVEFKAEKS